MRSVMSYPTCLLCGYSMQMNITTCRQDAIVPGIEIGFIAEPGLLSDDARARSGSSMKRVVALTVPFFSVGLAAANAAPPAEDVFVNLVAGQCLSETRGTALPAGSIDPRAVGIALTPRDRDPRLSKQALRIATANGAVYYDHSGEYCYVHAAGGVDNARTLAGLQIAFDRQGLKVESHNVTFPKEPKTDDPSLLRIVSMFFIDVNFDSTHPVVVISSVPAVPGILSAGVVMSRKQ
jgi:hypothetical protein